MLSIELRSLALTTLLALSLFAGTATGGVATAGNVPGEPPAVSDATHYTDASGDPVVELAFTEAIDTASVNDTTRVAVTLDNGTTLTAYDGGDRGAFSTRTLDSGRLVVETGTAYPTVANLTIEGVRDTDGETLDRQTVDVRYAATTVDTEGDAVEVYRGANVSLLRGTAVDTSFEIEGEDDIAFDMRRGTGPNSELYVWDTDGQALGTYTVDDGTDSVALTLESLGLNATVDEAVYGTDESVTGTVTADDIGREVVVELLADGDVEATRRLTIGSDGTATFAFDPVEAANYTVEARDLDTRVTASTAEFAVVDSGTATAGFASATYTEARGDVVTLSVTLDNTDTATVRVGDHEATNYNLTAEVVDEDGDGTVDLTVDTFAAGHGGATPAGVVAVEGEDTLAGVRQGGPFTTGYTGPVGSELLDAAVYDLTVTAGTDGDPDDVATLTLAERSTGNLTVWTAPGESFDDMDDLSHVREAREDGALTRTSTVAEGDLFVVAITANGLEGALDDTECFYRLSGQTRRFSLTYESDEGPNVAPAVHDVGELDGDDINVVSNETDSAALDTYYVVVAGDDLIELFGDHGSGDSYTANFTVHGDAPGNGLGDNNVSVADGATIEDPTVALDTDRDDAVVLGAAAGQTVTGDTNRAPGTDFTLELRSDGAAEPFLLTAPAVVRSDGSFRASVNLSAATPGDNLTAQLRLDGEDVGERYSGSVVAATPSQPTTPSTTVAATTTRTAGPDPTTDGPMDDATATVATTTAPPTAATAQPAAAGGSGPGFTAVGTALAVAALAVLATRRAG